jgi:putative sugar O-methyltransferase
MESQRIVSEAREHLAAWLKIPFPEEVAPSSLWEANLKEIDPAVRANSADDAIRLITSMVPVSAAIRTDQSDWRRRCDDTLRWLSRIGRPLGSLPIYVQDSRLSWSDAVAVVNHRRLSMAFLYHLCIAIQIEQTIGKVNSIFELGSGHGGLARVLKLLNPDTKFVFCDLPQTLFLCLVFLRRHFPHCTFNIIQRPEQLDGPRSADFTFVPAQLAGALAGTSVDLFVNTSSLSEMTQSAVGFYTHLVEDRMDVKYLYHLNRFGCSEPWLGNSCATSYVLDKHWEVLKWHWRNEASFNLVTFPETAPLLNLIARRIPKQIRSDLLYAGMVEQLRGRLAAAAASDGADKRSRWATSKDDNLPSDEWLSAIWDLVRLEGRPDDIEAYLKVMRPLNWRETSYFEAQLKSAA